MPLTATQLDRYNRAFIAALEEAEETLAPELAAALASVLGRFGDTVTSRVQGITEIPNGRGAGVPEWRVPTAAELRVALDTALREAIVPALAPHRERAIELIAERLAAPFSFEARLPSDPAFRSVIASSDSRILSQATNRTTNVPQDVWHRMASRLQDSYNKGEGVRPAAARIEEMVRGVNRNSERGERLVRRAADPDPKVARPAQAKLDGWSRSRARTIARTEIVSASNATNLAVIEAEQVATHKEWLATTDDRTRDTHIAINGERRPINETFSNGLKYPGDGNGAPAEVINCRCTFLAITPTGQGDGDVDSAPIIAAAFPVANPIPADWFTPDFAAEGIEVGERNADGYRPIVGRAYYDEQCLLHGSQDRTCVKPKDFAAADNFDWFHSLTGYAAEVDGEVVKPGPMILKHTPELRDPSKAKEIADDPERVVAVVRIVRDEYGAVYAGAILPHVDDETVALMPASQISPEWWPVRPESHHRLACLSLVSRGALPQTPEAIRAAADTDEPIFGLTCGCQEDDMEHPDIPAVDKLDPETVEALTDTRDMLDAFLATETVTSDPRIAAAATDEYVAWEAVLIQEGIPTADGRLIEHNALTWRETPLPLNINHGNDVSDVVGRIDAIWRDSDTIRARGVFDESEAGREAARLVRDEFVTGVSVELGNIDATDHMDEGIEVEDDGVHITDAVRLSIHTAKILAVGLVQVPAADEGQIEAVIEPDPAPETDADLERGLSVVSTFARLMTRKVSRRS